MKLDGEFNRAKTNKAYQLITWCYCDLFLNWIKSLKEEENSINIHKKLYIETKSLKLTTAIYPKILIIITYNNKLLITLVVQLLSNVEYKDIVIVRVFNVHIQSKLL